MIAGSALGVVVRQRAGTGVDGRPATMLMNASFGILTVDIVEGFLAEVAIPIDAEVLIDSGRIESADGFVGNERDSSLAGGMPQAARKSVGEVASHAAAIIVARNKAVVDLGGGGIAVVVARMVFQASINLMTVDVRIQVAHMFCISVPQACGGESLAVVINDHTAKDDLIASVPIDIGHAVVVVTVALPRTVGIAIPLPTHLQFMGGGVHVVGNHLVAGVDASGKEDTRFLAVEVGGAEEMLRRTVTIPVAPGGIEVVLTVFQSLQRVVDALIDFARSAIHINKVFRAVVHEPIGAATSGCAVVDVFLAYGVGGAVGFVDDGAVGSAHNGFGFAVAVPVVGHDVLLIVLEITHIGAAVDPPETGAVLLQHFEDAVFLRVYAANLGAVLRVGLLDFAPVVELHKDFQLAITVDISATSIVGDECTLDTFVRQSDFLVATGPYVGSLALVLFLAADDCRYRVL